VKVQPVLLEILFLLRKYAQGGLNVNAIYRELVARKFSRNKKLVLEAIDHLEKGKLLETINYRATNRRVKQKKTKILTILGYELLELNEDLDNYIKSCSKLQEAIKQVLDIKKYANEKIQRNVLRSRGWEPSEIYNIEYFFRTYEDLENLISPFQIINTMLIRYILVLQKISNNVYSKFILDYIIMENINRHLSNTVITSMYDTNSKLVGDKVNLVTDLMQRGFIHRFTDKQLEYVLLSMFDVLDVPFVLLRSAAMGRGFDEFDQPTDSDVQYMSMCQTYLHQKMKKKYGLQFNISSHYMGYISECNIQSQTKRGQAASVSVKIEVPRHPDLKIQGFTPRPRPIFLDLVIIDPINKRLRYPDPSTWDSNTDMGKIDLNGIYREYSSQWTYNIPSNSNLGEYKAIVILVGGFGKERQILDFQEKTFSVIS
jgi:hypothetical protein